MGELTSPFKVIDGQNIEMPSFIEPMTHQFNRSSQQKFNPIIERPVIQESKLQFPNNAGDISMFEEQKQQPEQISMSMEPIINVDPLEDEASIKHPYTYQKKIVEKILSQWGMDKEEPMEIDNPSLMRNYGSIIFIETGAGKSYISLMLIKSLFGEPHNTLAELTPEQLKNKRINSVGGPLQYDESMSSTRKKVVFIVPTNNLVDQQSSVIERYTEKVRVGKFQGGKNNKKVYKYENWIQQFRDNDVFVFIAKKFYDLLLHGYIKMDQLDLLILDEAHHTNQEHLYNLVMTDFFYAEYQPGLIKRPKILALTASPIKQKIEQNKIYKHEIEDFLQSLADNLYSKFVSVSAADLDEMRNECKIEVMTYESLFQFNGQTVKDIEQRLILQLLKLISPEHLPPQFYKVSGPQVGGNSNVSLLNMLNSAIYEEFKQEQDAQMLKFISTRKKFIDLEVDESKKIDLSLFRQTEDRTLILLIIMLLKNINNLVVELGMLGLQMFLIDLRRDLLQKQADKFKAKAKPIITIFNSFIDELIAKKMSTGNLYAQMLADEHINKQQEKKEIVNSEVSGKVLQLVNILETEYENNSKLKAIIFVKDRSVATYLKKILDMMFTNAQQKQKGLLDSTFLSFQNQGDQEEDYDEKKPSKFKCNFAIGFQGKSLTNKAYRSTKTIEDEVSQLTEFMPQFSHVKMTHQSLMKNIEDFKNDRINILIATSVIEEGLDVSSCNLVISINEVLNVKSFIQTKGRARQKNSKFIFLCAEEEKQQVAETIEGFKKLILNIQEIAYSDRDDKVILPNPNIVALKQKQPWMFLKTKPPFEAKCAMREAPTILELLCNEIVEELNTSRLRESELRPKNLQMSDYSKTLMEHHDSKRHKIKLKITAEERCENGKNKTFYAKLLLPDFLKYFFALTGGMVSGDIGFSKKKDSECYVQLIAVKRLYELGLYGEDLYPNINLFLNRKYCPSDPKPLYNPPQIFVPKQIYVPQPQIMNNPVKKYEAFKQPQVISKQQQQTKAQVSQQLMQAKQELQTQKEQYTKESKKASLPVPQLSVYLDRDLNCAQDSEQEVSQATTMNSSCFSHKQPQNTGKDSIMAEFIDTSSIMDQSQQVMEEGKFYILIFQGANGLVHDEINTQSSFCLRKRLTDQSLLDDSYPYKQSHESIGILWDRDLSNSELKLFIELQQENRQKHKNAYYLERIYELGLINSSQKDSMIQNADLLEMRIESITLDLSASDYITKIQKLKFFHFWFFYYVNNANYRLYKKLLQGTYSFSSLFTPIINFLKKVALRQQETLGINMLDHAFKTGSKIHQVNEDEQNLLKTFLVPIREGQINWKMIDDLVDFVKSDLLSFCLTDNSQKQLVIDKYDLIEQDNNSNEVILAKKIRHVWTCESNQNIFIPMSAQGSNDKLYNSGLAPSRIGKKIDISAVVQQSNITSSIMTNELDNDKYWHYKHISAHSNSHRNGNQSVNNISLNMLQNRIHQQVRFDSQTIAEHYFTKSGVYLSIRDNQWLYKCSKERPLMDFSVQKSTIINNQTEENKSNALGLLNVGKQITQQASTLFDVPQQLMRILPLRYEQYQMLQLSNFCYASVLEIVKVESFINKFLSDLRVHVDDPKSTLNLQQWDLTPKLEELANESSLKQTSSSLGDFMKQDFMIMMEAMTAPTANKPIDYERLEFYGDSVISFLVILELFLTTASCERDYKEGELDFYRIKAVSNMNLAQTNVQHKIFQYIITDSTKVIAEELEPPGFQKLEYHLKVKSKGTNEIKSKLTYLKKCEVILRQGIYERHGLAESVNSDYVDLVRMFLMQQELYQPLFNKHPDAWAAYENERYSLFLKFQSSLHTVGDADTVSLSLLATMTETTDLVWRVAEIWLCTQGITLDSLRLCVVQYNIERVEGKYRKEKNKKIHAFTQQIAAAQGKSKKKRSQVDNNNIPKPTEKLRHFQPKQLADTVESITGAISQAAGLCSAQDFLLKLGVLKYSTQLYEQYLSKFMSSNFTGKGYKVIMERQHDQLVLLQDIVGYKFKDPCLLVQAMTHKSFKEHFNTQKEHQSSADMRIDDYERLEFLGDSILNFLIAQYYFSTTKDRPQENQPKQLHKLKTSVVNNVFLSVIVVQRGIHKFVLYNQNSEQFKKQFDLYANVLQGILNKSMTSKMSPNSHSSSDQEMIQTKAEELNSQEFDNINIEPLYEHSLKIFGDILESLIGAIFLDSKSISVTDRILQNMMKPFLRNHIHVETLDDHSRTKLLELWNSKSYTKSYKIKHEVDQKPDGSAIFRGIVNRIEVRRMQFQKDMKNKVRRFYNDFYDFVEAFVRNYEEKHGFDAREMERELKDFRKSYKPPVREQE